MSRLVKKYGKLLMALGLSFGVMLLFKLFFTAVYETNDDYIMGAISYGYYGSPQAGLIYIHPLLGEVYALLQRLIPGASWYYLGELTILGLAMAALYRMAMERDGCVPVLAVLTLFYVGGLLFGLQYTKIAGTASAAGILVLFWALREKKSWGTYLAGFLLALSGYCLRSNAFFMVLIPLAGVGAAELFRRLHSKELRRAFGFVGTFAVLFALCGGLILGEKQYYGEDWAHYRQFNALRTELMDYGFPDYDENRELYASLRISEADLELFKRWDFGDPEVFNVDSMQALVDAKPSNDFRPGNILRCGKSAVQGLMRYQIAGVLLLAVLLWLWTADKWGIALGLYTLAAMVGTETWLLLEGRGLRPRVDVPLMLAAAAILLLACPGREDRRLPKGRMGMLLAAAMLLGQIPGWLTRNDAAVESWLSASQVQAAYRELSADCGTIYFFREEELPPNLLPGRQGGFGYYSNIASLGGWLTESPYVLERNATFGVENPYRDMVDAEHVRLVSNDPGPVLDYIREHYAPEAQAVQVGETCWGYKIWKVQTT